MGLLKRYWFDFVNLNQPTPLNLGCGVTAYDFEDAMRLLRERVFHSAIVPPIGNCIEDVDVSTLDQNHVLPNIGPIDIRGIWFPQGHGD
jgi:hypothetical protein